MNELSPPRLTVEDYLVWATSRPGRYELVNGRPIKMSPETTGHIKVKSYAWLALLEAVQQSEQNLIAVGDGATVKITSNTAFEPGALVYAGPELPGSEMIVPAPIIVVEVISPTSGSRDSGSKLRGYFQVPSVLHYLIVDPEDETLVHHRRGENSDVLTRTVDRDATLVLEPHGLKIDVSRFFKR